MILVENGERWLVAPYGEVNWVRNARAAGRVTLSRGRHRDQVKISEVGSQESAPVLREYLRRVRTVRPFFDVSPDSPLEAIAARVAELLADRAPSEPPELLTVRQAAELAGVSLKTMRNWLSSGRLTRQGNTRRGPVVARVELLALLAGRPRRRKSRRAGIPKRPEGAGTFAGLARDGR